MPNSSFTPVPANTRGRLQKIDCQLIADDTDGSLNITENLSLVGILVGARISDSSPAPTTLWDVVLNDDDGNDILSGGGANITTGTNKLLSAADLNEYAISTTSINAVVTGNSVNSAAMNVQLLVVSVS